MATRRRTTSPSRSFFRRVYAQVSRIPRGRVATYGQVAMWLGVPSGARAVGWALRALPDELSGEVPWHRVVGFGGRISHREGPGPILQRRLLRSEGVCFVAGRVDLARHAFAGEGAGYTRLARGSESRSRARWITKRARASSRAAASMRPRCRSRARRASAS